MSSAVRIAPFLSTCLLTLLVTGGAAIAAVPPSDTLLPASTVAYVSVADPDDLEARWHRTQFGQFAEDPSLDPFFAHLRERIPERLGDMQSRVGIGLDDLQGVAAGELAWAIVARQQGRAASVLLLDTTGNDQQRNDLIAKVDEYLMDRDSEKSTSETGDITITSYQVPADETVEDSQPHTAAYFVHDGLLCVADHHGLVTELAGRLTGEAVADTVGALEEYRNVMAKCQEAADGVQPDIRWFAQPFPLVDAMRTIRPRVTEGEDRLVQLREQGFDAVRGVGGWVNVAYDERHDFIHRTAIYAPPVEGATEGNKYRLGMNIFKLPNSNALAPHNWTPRMIARYTTINVDLLHAFDNLDTLFDTIVAGYEGAFETAMDRFKNDPFGPGIDFRNEIVAGLGTRVSLMTDYTLPIDTDSERFLVAIEVKAERAETLRVAIGKYLEKDGYVQKEVAGREIWEFKPVEDEDLDVGLGDGGLFPEAAEDPEPAEQRLLTRSAVCVSDGHLFIASDVEFLRLAFQQAAQNEALDESFDYLAVEASLARLAPGERCSWSFTRLDETIRPTYELLREGRLPESETFFGRLLNELLTTPQQQRNQLLREQRLDGSELPTFELARRYFGPSGRSVRSDEDGWMITGVLLNKASY